MSIENPWKCETCGREKHAFCFYHFYRLACPDCDEIALEMGERHTLELTQADAAFLLKTKIMPVPTLEGPPPRRMTVDDVEFLRAVGITPDCF